MQAHQIPIFKSWVPEWVARGILFLILLTSAIGFALYANNPESIQSFYGVEPNDVQFSIVLMYASIASFLALDFRTVKYFTTRRYLLTGLFINAVCYIICFYTKNWELFLLCRFILGISCALITSIVLNLIFPRIHSSRARVIAYTIFYSGLQMISPLCGIYTSSVLHYLDFNWLFFGLLILLVPVILIVYVSMNRGARIFKKFPLFDVDLTGYLLYTVICIMTGYVLVFGQQLNWFGNIKIRVLSMIIFLALALFVLREVKLKRPLVDLRLLQTRNVVLGLLILFVFYIFKSTSGFTYGYLEHVLGTDPLNIIPIWASSIAVTVLSMFVTSRFVLAGFSMIKTVITGFIILGLFYIYMLLFISDTGETNDFILPVCLFSIATGVIFVPAVIFTFSAAPPKIAFNTSIIGMFARFMGFCIAIAINNYLQLYSTAAINEKIRESVTETNPQLERALIGIEQTLVNNGGGINSGHISSAYLKNYIHTEVLSRSIRDYYDFMLVLLVTFIAILIAVPGINKVVLRLRKGSVPY
ncbi:MFS transporter [Epilithonimonas hungarica]|uniref:Major Facilitator Superfamily protein n=1 Tax=Epilithonimonas hungarica TaxID=454006 RepID=A0A1G7SU31_9FLAO|nr:MFS transporter [Epilithonimonas hungarica]SDG25949.1 Major Facilitator Superfamily protein [Epilithonimonas hungarica]